MKCVDVLIGVSNFNNIHLFDADTWQSLGVVNANQPNNTCRIYAGTPNGVPDFSDYTIVSADNYSNRRVLGFWDYGADKVVLDIPQDTGSGRMDELFDYSTLPIFDGYLFKTLTLMPGIELYTDPSFPVIAFTPGDVKITPITPNIANMLGIRLMEA